MNKDVEQALFDHVASRPELSVDDMLWWLYDTYKLVVGTRTIRRAFERRNTSHKKFRNEARKDMTNLDLSQTATNSHPSHQVPSQPTGISQPELMAQSIRTSQSELMTQSIRTSQPDLMTQPIRTSPSHSHSHSHSHSQLQSQSVVDHGDGQFQPQPAMMTQSTQSSSMTYQSPYAPMLPMPATSNAQDISPELARAIDGLNQAGSTDMQSPDMLDEHVPLSEDEETLQLQLQQIALQKRELELKLKMRRLQRARSSPFNQRHPTESSQPSFMTDLSASAGTVTSGSHARVADSHSAGFPDSPNSASGGKMRDSRSKSKVEEAKRRTEERQEKMLKDLEQRSRRREHLTAEWVQSRDVWAKGPEKLLVDLMHQHSTYAHNQNSLDTFEAILQGLYQLVDQAGWYAPVHDQLLRERTRRKMSQLRSKMVKSGEIVSRGEGYGGWIRADPSIDESLPLDSHPGMQHDMTDMSDLPLDMSALSNPRQQQHSEEALMAQNAMMHAPHEHSMMQQHHGFHQHDSIVFGQNIDPAFSQHQRVMQDGEIDRQNALNM